ncbi:MAG: hypothetical protein LBQ46_08070 [Treponema sp.]|nr:hypothetical protein [Treponema sp.]
MKNGFLANLVLPVLLLAGCTFLMGPDEPVGENTGTGTLTVSFGEAGGDRAVSSGKDLPAEILAVLRYEVSFTGPGDVQINRTVSSGGTINLSLTEGPWRIDASAYYGEDLMGTGSLSFELRIGNTSVRVPMYMSGPLYEISIPATTGGTVASNFSLAFPGTAVALTVTPAHDGAVLKPNALAVNGGGSPVALAGSGAAYTFTMPAADVAVAAEFLNGWRYARETAAGTGDGSSWANASNDLQKMMDEAAAAKAAGAPDALVRVAAGTYKPRYKPNSDGTTDYATIANDRDSAFILRQGVEVRGGYPTGGGNDASRDPSANVTLLSGDIGTVNTNTDNAYHVVLAVNIPAGSGTVLDGFTISGGYADGTGTLFAGNSIDRTAGGGMYNNNASPVLTNVILSGNLSSYAGGGMYSNNSSPILTNVTISGNTSYSNGGGMRSDSSSPVLTNVTISGNRTYNSGGGMSNNASSLVLTNVTISGNRASSFGGGMTNESNSSSILTNVTISGNKAGSGGGGMLNAFSSPQIRNSIIWGNDAPASPGISNDTGSPAIAYSIVQGGSAVGDGNVADPGAGSTNSPFVDWQDPADSSVTMPNSAGDYRLKPGSPAIDAGDNAGYPDTWAKWQSLTGTPAITEPVYNGYVLPALAKDLGGNSRFNGAIDMGGYER